MDIPSSNLSFFLSRGSPFITASVKSSTSLSITTLHTILSLSPSNNKNTKYTLKLNNTQTWLIYTDSPIFLNTLGASQVTSKPFSGIIRVAALPHDNPNNVAVLDRFSSSYPSSGNATLEDPFRLVYQWKKEGSGDLLMLAHPLHVKLLSNNKTGNIAILHDFKYSSIDGDLVGVVGDSWKLQMNPIPVTWHSNKGLEKASYQEIVSVLSKDVQSLNSPIATASSYAYGKLIGRAARLALIAEEVSFPNVIPTIKEFLKKNIEPWLDGTFPGNAKIDNAWGNKYKPQVYALLSDFMNLDQQNAHYPRLRCFDLYRLHSWASGLTEFGDGRNQESTSEAVNAYYSAALVGLAYGDSRLVATGSTLLAMEILATQTWWHVKVEDNLHNKEFAKDNRIVGVLWSNKRDSALWWAAATCRECRVGIQVLPLLPITETLFSDAAYVKELVEWTLPSLSSQSWKGMTYALQGIYD
ncbi:hypothetical protein V8G54_021080 [Vigna mungo]|uniref:glucan endo-1,3-beta-D-glucosidase n=1 Tax=Vigna mungo TaxID=3915 RepID=A0AAQ3RTY8_VIGMU